MRPPVWIADLWRATRALAPCDPAAVAAIRGALGLDEEAGQSGAGPARPARPAEGGAEAEPRGAVSPRPDAVGDRPTGEILDAHLVALPPEPPQDPPDWSGVPSLPLAPASTGLLHHEPLLAPVSSRSTLSAALAARTPDGPIDIARLVDLLAHGSPIACLPRHTIPTLRLGVDVVCDAGDGMAPFARDQRELVAEVKRVVGAHRTRVSTFVGPPLLEDAGEGEPAWRPPPRGAPILVLSDLGIGRRSALIDAPAQWFDFAVRAGRAGCPVVALVPYTPGRWPAALARVMAIVHWDRAVTAASASHAVAAARRSRGDWR